MKVKKDYLKRIPEITLAEDVKGDSWYSRKCREACARDKHVRANFDKLTSYWSIRTKKYDSPDKIVMDLLSIRTTVSGLLRIHGIPKATVIDIATLAEGCAGLGGFLDKARKHPRILIDKTVYDKCEWDEVVDTYCGIALHEAGHVNHSKIYPSDSSILESDEVACLYFGLFEDERVESLVIENSPGFVGYVHVTKQILLHKVDALGNWNELPDVDKVNTLIFKSIRAPYLLTEEEKEWIAIDGRCVFKLVQNVIGKGPSSDEEAIYIARDLSDLLKSYRDIYSAPSKESSGGESSGGESSERSEGFDVDDSEGIAGKGALTSDDRSGESEDKKGGSSKRGDSSAKVDERRKADFEDKVYRENKKALERATSTSKCREDHMKDACLAEEGDRDKEKKAKTVKIALDALAKDREGRRFSVEDLKDFVDTFEKVVSPLDFEETKSFAKFEEDKIEVSNELPVSEAVGVSRRVVFASPKITPVMVDRYQLYYRSVRNHVQAMRRVFQFRLGTRVYPRTQLSEGRLDRRMLGRAVTTSRIFKRQYTKTDKGIAICLLMDESGSMGGACVPNDGSKASRCLQVAVLIGAALENTLGIELEVYSFTSIGTGHVDCYLKHLYGAKRPKIEGIAGYNPGSENYDHLAIQEVHKRFRADTSNDNRLMLVLSDGEPLGRRYGGESAIRATKDAVSDVRRKGDRIMQVAIESFRSEAMFGKDVVRFTNLNTLCADMRKLVQKVVKDAAKR